MGEDGFDFFPKSGGVLNETRVERRSDVDLLLLFILVGLGAKHITFQIVCQRDGSDSCGE